MDPLTALGFAGNVIQFIDLGTKLLGRFREIFASASGSHKLSDELSSAILDLDDLTKALKTSTASMAKSSHQTRNYAELLAIAREAESSADELLSLLAKFRPKGTGRWSSATLAFKYTWHRRELEAETFRLDTLKANLLHLVLALQFNERTIQTSKQLQELDSYSRAAVLALANQQASTESGDDISYATSAGQLLNRLEGQGTVAESTGRQGQSPPRTEEKIRQEVERSLLRFLSYEVMSNRILDISAPSVHTFEWIFQNQPPEHKWSSFPDWLAHRSGLYWINGNEASGKSTMMKYIYNHSETQECLKVWAQTTPLATAAFFFLRSGSRLEKSQEGLLRSLLFTVLSKQSHLLPSVLPQEWATLYSRVSGESDSTSPSLGAWNISNLREAFKRLIRQEQSPVKLFFLVDGLDEYEGNISEIVELFTNDISSSFNAKALVSSRPLTDFDNFKKSPGLTLHNLNHDDIRAYVLNHLQNSGAFLEVARDDPETATEIIRYILDMSNGLFLWVVLVVRTIQETLDTGRNLDYIRQELKSHLPPVLDELYREIWSRIPQLDQVQASQILQIVLAGRIIRKDWAGMSDDEEPLTLIDLAFADGDPEETIVLAISPWSYAQIRERCNRVAKTFMTKWPGFIEIQTQTDKQPAEVDPASRIRYCHRSVMEFLNRKETRVVLLAATAGKSFCPYVAHLKSAVHHLKILRNPLPSKPLPLLWTLATLALVSANQIELTPSQSATYPVLLAQLDNTMKHHHVNLQQQPDGQWIEKGLKSSHGVLEMSDRGRDSKRRAKLHWSNFHPDPKCSHPMKWEDCFLSLVIQFGLRSHLENKLGQGSRELKSKRGRPLLDYALDPLPIVQYELITPAIVEILLCHGAAPNERFEKKTCWENALRWQYENFAVQKGRSIGGSMAAREVAEIRLQIFQLLIDHGVDVNISVETSVGKLAARKLVTDSFKPWTTDESFHSLIHSFEGAATTQGKHLHKFRQLIS